MLDSIKKHNKAEQEQDNTLISISELVFNLEKQTGKIKFDKGSTGQLGVYQLLPVGIFLSDKMFQRLLSKNNIQKAKALDLELFQPLVVFKRPAKLGGQYSIVDGQHKAVMAYLGMGSDYEVPCVVHEHDPDASLDDCMKREAMIFEELNMSRKNATSIDKYKAGIAYGDAEALKFEMSLISIGVYVETLGDTEYGVEAKGWVKLKSAWTQYGLKHTKNAVDFLKPIYAETWNKDYIDGSLVYALAALNNLKANHLGALKEQGLNTFLAEYFHKTKSRQWIEKSAGNSDYIIISRRIIDKSNTLIQSDVIEGAIIGEAILDNARLGDIGKLK